MASKADRVAIECAQCQRTIKVPAVVAERLTGDGTKTYQCGYCTGRVPPNSGEQDEASQAERDARSAAERRKSEAEWAAARRQRWSREARVFSERDRYDLARMGQVEAARPDAATELWRQLRQLAGKRENKPNNFGLAGAVLYGPTGTGKTYAAFAVMNELISKDPTLRLRAVDERRLLAGEPWLLDERIDRFLADVDVVLIDDVGRALTLTGPSRISGWDAVMSAIGRIPRPVMVLLTTNLHAVKAGSVTCNDEDTFNWWVGSHAASRLLELPRVSVTVKEIGDRRAHAQRIS